jgi:hypothetical protein
MQYFSDICLSATHAPPCASKAKMHVIGRKDRSSEQSIKFYSASRKPKQIQQSYMCVGSEASLLRIFISRLGKLTRRFTVFFCFVAIIS